MPWQNLASGRLRSSNDQTLRRDSSCCGGLGGRAYLRVGQPQSPTCQRFRSDHRERHHMALRGQREADVPPARRMSVQGTSRSRGDSSPTLRPSVAYAPGPPGAVSHLAIMCLIGIDLVHVVRQGSDAGSGFTRDRPACPSRPSGCQHLVCDDGQPPSISPAQVMRCWAFEE
jgi:hypothetical protein